MGCVVYCPIHFFLESTLKLMFFFLAGRLLRRKLPIGGHLITPRRLWLQSIATRQCDVVMTFPKGASDSTLLWLLRKLRSATPRLTVCVRHHPSTQTTAFYLTASFQV